MYRLTKNNYKTECMQCDRRTARNLMQSFIDEHGLYLTSPVDCEKRRKAPSVVLQNWAYEKGVGGGNLRALLYYDKKEVLHICHHINDEVITVRDEEFVPTLLEMLQPYRANGCTFDQFPDRIIISKDGYWVDMIYVDHFRRLRNMKGEIFEQRI